MRDKLLKNNIIKAQKAIIDIGTDSTKLLEVSYTSKEINIDEAYFFKVGYDGETSFTEIAKKIDEKLYGRQRKDVIVVIPANLTESKIISVKNKNNKDANKVVHKQCRTFGRSNPLTHVVTASFMGTREEQGDTVTYYLISSVQKGIMNELIEAFADFGMKITRVVSNQFNQVCLSEIFADDFDNINRILVDFGKADYISNLSDILYAKDTAEIDKSFQEVAENSVAYMTMVRLGIDPDEKFVFEDFARISEFDTIESVSILGDAVSAFSEEVLREIHSTLIAEVKKEKENQTKFAENENIEYSKDENIIQNERSKENVTDNVSQRERNTDTEPQSTRERQTDREIRDDAEEIPQTEQEGHILGDDDTGDIDGASSGDRPDGENTGNRDGSENGEIGGSGRETESSESAEVDRAYEQPQTFRRRGSAETVSSQLTLFDLVNEGNVQENMQREAERLNGNHSAFSVSQQIIDEVLASGPNGEKSILNICIEMSKGKSLESQAEFLQQEYKAGGKGFIFDGTNIATWWDNTGLRISRGKDTVIADTVLSWEDVAKRINELLDMGRFAPKDILDVVHETKVKRAADSFWYMHSDVNFDAYPELSKMFREEWFEGGFPKSTARLCKMVETPEELDRLIGVTKLLEGVNKNHENVMRWKQYSPEKVLPVLGFS